MFTKIFEWVKVNWLLSLVLSATLVVLLFPKLFKSRIKRTRYVRQHILKRSARYAPRAVSNHGVSMEAKKKPWQIKGSLAAKKRMAEIRRKR